MPQANDSELTQLYTASAGFDVEDNEPNTGAPGQGPAVNFDLHLEAVAGNVIGNGGGDYSLEITCIDETLAAPNAGMSPGVLNQQYAAGDGWTQGGAAGNFMKEQVFRIRVPQGVRGHVFHYIATLVSIGNDQVSFRQGNSFILV